MSNTEQNNSGHRNSGHHNSGHRNSGHHNSGHHNSGNHNSGHHNSGNHNSGHHNSGDHNSGDHNSGLCNSGNFNSGHHNSGLFNSGLCNSGNFNSGHHNSGFFCTETPRPMFFDQPVDMSWEDAEKLIPNISLPASCVWVSENRMTNQEKLDNPNYKTLGGYLKSVPMSIQEAFPKAWAKLDEKTKQRFLNLPNFDAEKFYKCTGVDVRKNSEEKTSTVTVKLATGETIQIEGQVVENGE